MAQGHLSQNNNTETIWLSQNEASKLLGIKIKTLRQNCRDGVFRFKIRQIDNKSIYYVTLDSLPEKNQEIYLKIDTTIPEKDIDNAYSNAPEWAKSKAEKYITIIKACKGLAGNSLEGFIIQWNKANPDLKTSYPSVNRMRKRFEEFGMSGLLAQYGSRYGETVIGETFFEYFKNLCLVEGAPSLYSCWEITRGFAIRQDNIDKEDFPSYQTFRRRLEREVPKQAIYLARYGHSKWNKKYGSYIERDYSTIICGKVWVADHAQIDVGCIKKVAEVKHISSRAVRLSIQSDKYIAREVKTRGGITYEILISSLEPDIQGFFKPQQEVFYYPTLPSSVFIPDTAKTVALARIDLIKQWFKFRIQHSPRYQGDKLFIEMYNSGEFLKRLFKIIGKTSRGSLQRWKQIYDEFGTWEALTPQYRYSCMNSYKTILTDEMLKIFLKILLHPNQFNIGKSINLTIQILKTNGIDDIPSIPTFRRYAENFKKYNYDKWVLMREGEKALKDKVEPYIERDISKLEVGDVLIADGHKLNFQVINPFTGKPTRATLVGFLDWKSGALVGYEIMLEENTQCIASALRMAILNLGLIPKIVYQDNGRAFRAKYFQSCSFEEVGFNGVYQNLGIKSVFAKPYNARAKVICPDPVALDQRLGA